MVQKMKIEFLARFSNTISTSPPVSFYSVLHSRAKLGLIGGFFPVQNASHSQTAADLKVKKKSWSYFYSVCILCVKLWILVQYFLMGRRFKDILGTRTGKPTDNPASTLAFVLSFAFGAVAHILALWRLPLFLEMFQAVEQYDFQYGFPMKRVKFLRRRKFIAFTQSILLICTPVYCIYLVIVNSTESRLSDLYCYLVPWLWKITNPILVLFIYLFTFIALEWGSLFLNFQAFFSSRLLAARFEKLISVVEKMYEPKHSLDDKSLFGPSPSPSWKSIGDQYIAFLFIYKKYKKFIGPYFTILFGASMTSCTCMIFYLLTSNTFLAQQTAVPNWVLILFSLGKMYAFADCGQTFQNDYEKLVVEIMKNYQKHSYFDSSDKSEVENVIKLVTASQLTLPASGFFNVSRRNLTSIVSTMITYLVVLFQFSAHDDAYIEQPNADNIIALRPCEMNVTDHFE